MPGYRGHSVGGVLAALGGLWVIVRFFPSIIIDAPYILIAFFSAFVGARLPDLDIKSASRAFGTRVLLILSLCLLCAGYWHSAGLVLITTAAVYFVRHRGITHSLLFWILILFLVAHLIWIWKFTAIDPMT